MTFTSSKRWPSTNALRLANFSRAANGTTFSLIRASVHGNTYQPLLTNQWFGIGDSTTNSSALTVLLAPVDARRFNRVRVLP